MMQRLRQKSIIRTDTNSWLLILSDDFTWHHYARLREIHFSILLDGNLVEG
jgi:hypothetical protein